MVDRFFRNKSSSGNKTDGAASDKVQAVLVHGIMSVEENDVFFTMYSKALVQIPRAKIRVMDQVVSGKGHLILQRSFV